ncbi:YfbR-like 5'-deoxynucleotidase [Sulfitobacter sp. PM12]|uniref:YfbR-like 5'-deoxynucleotidase n=1 Tax=Sulfitobacter sp. PM12 TaxID=3138497 RepID=UPI00388F6B28
MNSPQTVRRIIGPTILLSNAEYFDFDAPVFGPDVVEVIAHSLAMQCRFTGHCSRFYSVAEHSVHASHIVPPELSLIALLHDGAEAFCGDMAKPLKEMLPEYKAIEERIEAALFQHLGIELPLPSEIKTADRAMLAVEQGRAMGNADGWHYTHGVSAARVELQFWTPDEAKSQFLARYESLTQ